MTSSPSAPVFSRWVSWLGILILGAGVASATPTSSVAAAPALATSSLEFSALSSSLGTLSGAAPEVSPTRVVEETAEPEPVAAEVPPAVNPEPEYTWPDPSYLRVEEPQIPEPVNAGAWLGVSLAAVALGGGWLGFWRRIKARQE
ncbi:hypothetical protein OAR17_00380 [Pontimonas sp.]|nr:hypothetical protein [Pontimonas sp.]